MRVTVDDQIFTVQRWGGVSRYFTELIERFRRPDSGVAVRTPFRYVVNDHVRDADPGRFHAVPVEAVARRYQLVQALNAVTPPRRADRTAILHHTYYRQSRLRTPARKRVCTIYDLIPELMPELFPAGRLRADKKAYIEACDALLCISHTTKADLLAQYGPLDKPVIVTPLGFPTALLDTVPPAPAAVPYLLFVGARFGYKNVDVLWRAVARLRAEGTQVRVVCTGGGQFTADESARLAELDLADVVEQRNTPDAELGTLYAGAAAMVFPSRYEGFGLPIVEAFAAGCPVVLADMPCSVEVGGDAAQFVGADDDEALAAVLDRLAADEAERQRWRARGRVRAGDFTWERTAELTRQAYRELG